MYRMLRIHDLPAEILQHLFNTIFEHSGYHEVDNGFRVLTAVCSRWREVIHSSSFRRPGSRVQWVLVEQWNLARMKKEKCFCVKGLHGIGW